MLAVLQAAAAREGALLKLLDREADRDAVARLVEHAAAEQALTPDTSQETAAWSGRSRGAREGVPAANVPAEAAGAMPMRTFAGSEQSQSRLGQDETDGTVFALLATPGDGAVEQVQAGEALSAVLLEATRFGLATDPISQPLEVRSTRAQLCVSLLDGAAEPQVLLRLGWAPMSSIPVPQTGRRPVTDTIDAMDLPWN
jgi:hypothetical protein